MTFSYTDDAIISTSPTGRHLSTVIKRPVVLMPGWAEHAEAVCKVLNELAPGSSIGTLSYRVEVDCSQVLRELDKLEARLSPGDLKELDAEKLGELRKSCEAPMPPRFDYSDVEAFCNPDYSSLEARATPEQVRKCDGRKTYTVRLTIGGREAFTTVPAEEAAPLLMMALEERDAKLAAVAAELEELQAKPVVAEVDTDALLVMYHAPAGTCTPLASASSRKVTLMKVGA